MPPSRPRRRRAETPHRCGPASNHHRPRNRPCAQSSAKAKRREPCPPEVKHSRPRLWTPRLVCSRTSRCTVDACIRRCRWCVACAWRRRILALSGAHLMTRHRSRRRLVALLGGALLLTAGACVSKRVTRIEPTAATDLSGRWKDIERALLTTGAARVVASGDERAELRGERKDQQQYSRADTRTRPGQELGARYVLAGELQAIEDVDGHERVVFYQVDASLIDLETNAKVWVGQHKIKKYVERARFGL